jgi:hypothetical protein
MQQSTLDRAIVFADNEHEIEMTERRYTFSMAEASSDRTRWILKEAALDE